ncbi:MAG: type I secretion C-terminal target domain-containing protein [Methyloceanibacter sp.]|uniref:type I secretion C-terminal target domain-containing protein n=1 Tax=Methyloceanibacter sp. TaxID=1965321 RepID=UPI003D6D5DF8
MADVTLSLVFNSDVFWAPRSGASIVATDSTYEFQNVAGNYVVVSGSGLDYDGDDPLAGTYDSILVYTDAAHTTLVAKYETATPFDFATYFSGGAATALAGQDTLTGSAGSDVLRGHAGDDTIIGGDGADTIDGGDGADILDGGDGGDTYEFGPGDIDAGEVIDDTGASGTDTIVLRGFVGGVANFAQASVAGIEAIAFMSEAGLGGSGIAHFDASQLPSNLAITGVDTIQQTISVATGTNFSASGWTFTDWNDDFDTISINGTSGDDTIVGSNQADLISGRGGADTLDGGNGGDTYIVDGLETINDTGVDGIDVLAVAFSFDFRSMVFSGIDGLNVSNASTVTFNAGQLPGNFAVSGGHGTNQTLAIENAANFSAAAWTFTNWEGGTGTDALQVLGGSALTLSGLHSIDEWEGNNQGVLGNANANVLDFSALTSKIGLPFVDGRGGNDVITGSQFADVLRGGSGRDKLYGGADADHFDFNFIGETKVGGNRDIIHDFSRNGGDVIDLKDIDAKKGVSGNNKFNFIGKQDFHEKKGELHYVKKAGYVMVEGDVNGDGKADFQIKVNGVSALDAGDFTL